MKSSRALIPFLFLALLQGGCSGRDQGPPSEAAVWCADHNQLPVYPAAKTDKVVKGEVESCAMAVSSDFASVSSWYVRALNRGGWQVFRDREKTVVGSSPSTMYLLEKGNTQITLSIAQPVRGKKTSIVFTLVTGKMLHNNYDRVNAAGASSPSNK